jgi:hypothetical protein
MSQEFRRLDGKPSVNAFQVRREMMVTTPDGVVIARVGDWIVTTRSADMYVCLDEVFRAKYVLATPPGY